MSAVPRSAAPVAVRFADSGRPSSSRNETSGCTSKDPLVERRLSIEFEHPVTHAETLNARLWPATLGTQPPRIVVARRFEDEAREGRKDARVSLADERTGGAISLPAPAAQADRSEYQFQPSARPDTRRSARPLRGQTGCRRSGRPQAPPPATCRGRRRYPTPSRCRIVGHAGRHGKSGGGR